MKQSTKKLSTYRLSETTRQQIKTMADYDQLSEADIIEYAINKVYNLEFKAKIPDLPELKLKDYLISQW